MRFASNGVASHLCEHTGSRRAEARCSFENGQRLRTVNEACPVSRPPADLLSGEFLDEHHGSAAVRAKPGCGRLGLTTCRRFRALLGAVPQQLLAEWQKLFPAPIREEAGKANPDESAR